MGAKDTYICQDCGTSVEHKQHYWNECTCSKQTNGDSTKHTVACPIKDATLIKFEGLIRA